MFIAATCVECYCASILAAQKHSKRVPMWVKLLTDASLVCNMMSFGRHKKTSEGTESTNQTGTQDKGIEMRHNNNGPAHDDVANPIASAFVCNYDSGHTGEGPDGGPSVSSGKKEAIRVGTGNDASEYTWERGSRSLDRIVRVVLPLLYVILVSVALGAKL